MQLTSRSTKKAGLLPEMTANRYAALCAWMLGVALTAYGLSTFLVSWPVAVGIAVIGQALLTFGQRTIWTRDYAVQRYNVVTLSALAVDAGLNAAGMFPYALNIDQSPAWLLLAADGALPEHISMLFAGGLSLLIGVWIAALPEELWSRED